MWAGEGRYPANKSLVESCEEKACSVAVSGLRSVLVTECVKATLCWQTGTL